ncbi:MAG TPA: SCP2 sterol-binding domain-containing protein [Candidatus Dormibacteraeota bacterium]|nr:SCP2 sterol-binding domain-containing protein [Candidatus Dormibacteraeota bacterium]
MPTPAEIFAEIDQALQADPTRAQGVNGTYAFDLTGDDGGQYHVVLKDGKGEAGPGAPEDPNVTISMKSGDFVDLRLQKLDPTMAFMTGRLKVKGDMGLAMKLQSVLRPS